ncbi:beta-lactamase family protein [Microbulbifer sp. OS29]|uniref:Beta-lactamase family protein n=1 Tax=Microbulbifer okhotskensis TaxID=2926617 RepID=A0A9X2ENY1_9GAMM|nr:serine hydrolase domain-containing protein [Microbulbifer okhotskensis]MCO1335080.1 beta-lactamase family protein [Microbulbifer okhotskensis]
MKITPLMVFLIAGLGLFSCSDDRASPTTSYTTAEAFLESEGFVGTILVKKNGVDTLRKGFGFANKELPLPNGINTRYRVGSLSKTLTALAIVQLKNSGEISDYDTPVSEFIPDYPGGEKITIRHLLTHRSGIPEFFNGVDHHHTFSPLELVNLSKNSPLEFEPGEKYSYSNSNYILLGYLIELLSGQSYTEFLSRNILEPLGMDATTYGSSEILDSGHATGYKGAQQAEPAKYIDMSIPYSAGALSSNLADLEVWSESFAKELLVSTADKKDIFIDDGYGFGWVTTSVAGKKVITQSGGIYGFSALIIIFPEENSLIIGLTNLEGEQANLKRMAAIIAENEF